MRIRKAKPTDKEKILILVKKFYGKSSPRSVRIWQNNYKNMSKWTYVAEARNKILGYISHEFKDNLFYIADLYVLSKFRRKGIGTILLKKANDLWKKSNKKLMIVNNRKRDKGAFNFYTKFGFEVWKEKSKKSLILRKCK